MTKRSWLKAMVGTMVVSVVGCNPDGQTGGSGSGASFPTKTITVVCPWAPGGGTDRVSRFLADQLEKKLGKPVVVQNKTGGGGAVGHTAGATARPDGHTILMGTFELSTMHWMGISPLTYADYQPLMQVNADAAAIFVKKDSPWNDLKSFLDHVKANPGKVQMSGTATGGAWDLARSGMLLAADIPVGAIRWIPTQGSAPSLVQLMGGHIDAVCCSVPEAAPQVDAGELKALVVMSGERLPEYPDIPTVAESGVDWEAVGWRGLLLPKKTPENVVTILADAVSEIVASDAYKDFMKKNGFGIVVKSPLEFGEFLKKEDAQWQAVIEAAGFAKK
jgi:tripartite-type tricarboxylate transporter receptor subunit TctC